MAQIKWDQKITAYIFFSKIGLVVVHAKGRDFASLFAFLQSMELEPEGNYLSLA